MKKHPAHSITPLKYFGLVVFREVRSLLFILSSHRVLVVSLFFLILIFFISIFSFANRKISIVADQVGSSWYKLAESARASIESKGFSYDIPPSAGSVENVRILNDSSMQVNAALLLPNVLDSADLRNLMSLGNIDYEAIWIVYRKGLGSIKNLKDFSDLRIGVGPKGSGRFIIAEKLFQLHHIDAAKKLNFTSESLVNQIKLLQNQQLDALIFIANPLDAVFKELVETDNVEFFSFKNTDAYIKNIPALQSIVVPEGALDIDKQIPDAALHLLAVTTTLAVKKTTSATEQIALLMSMKEVARRSENLFFAKPNELPAYLDTTIELSPVAKDFYASGPPILTRYLPFSLAMGLSEFGFLFIALYFIVSILRHYEFASAEWIHTVDTHLQVKDLVQISKAIANKNLSQEALKTYLLELDAIESHLFSHHLPVGLEMDVLNIHEKIRAIRQGILSKII